MHSSVETLTENKVKVTVHLDESEFESEIDAAFKRIAREVRIPGFRPGRAPRRLLEAQLGVQAGRIEALRSSLPDYYTRAVVEHDIDVIDAPEIEITEGSESGPVCFDAVVDVRPVVTVTGYSDLRVEIPSPIIPDAEIDEEIDAFRSQFAELSPVKRTAVDGDHLTIDIVTTHGGETLDGLTTSDYDYLLGTGAVVPEIDENLRGTGAGDILEFTATHPDPDEDDDLRFRILVKEVQEPVLPELDDDFVADNTEHESVEGFRTALRDARARTRVLYAAAMRREAIADAVAALVLDEVPEAMIALEVEARREQLMENLSNRGSDLDSYLADFGQSQEDFDNGLRQAADRGVKLDLALRAVAAAEGLEADVDAVDEQLREALLASPDASRVNVDEEAVKLRETLASAGRLSSIRSQISKRAALEWITERVELIDPEGTVIDPEQLQVPDEPGSGVLADVATDDLYDDLPTVADDDALPTVEDDDDDADALPTVTDDDDNAPSTVTDDDDDAP